MAIPQDGVNTPFIQPKHYCELLANNLRAQGFTVMLSRIEDADGQEVSGIAQIIRGGKRWILSAKDSVTAFLELHEHVRESCDVGLTGK